MFKIIALVVALALATNAQVLRISPAIVGSPTPGEQQIIILSRGGGGGSVGSGRLSSSAGAGGGSYRPLSVQPKPVASGRIGASTPGIGRVGGRASSIGRVGGGGASSRAGNAGGSARLYSGLGNIRPISSNAGAPSWSSPSSLRANVAAVATAAALVDKPQPYAFNFDSEDEYGTKLGRQESSDGSGTITGTYTLSDATGISREVSYVADKAGFRAAVRTNEPGTLTSNPADVNIESSATLR